MSLQTDRTEVLFQNINNAGVITLNRPKALNALNSTILSNMLPKLQEWEKSKQLVIIKGAGYAFCAGGDLKEVVNVNEASPFALVEYNINYMIKKYRIPYIAFLDGVAMGGGLGVSVHGRYRIATENTVVAMPETKIGLIPDVGGTYFLPRLPYNIGIYLALTSNKLRGEDAIIAGIATHFVPSKSLPILEIQLSNCSTDADIQNVLSNFNVASNDFTLASHLENINYCFAPKSIEEVIARLEQINNEWSTEIIAIIHGMCPLTLKLTLQALHLGATLDLWSCLKMEYRLVTRLSKNYNFKEGVRALLIDKDNKPRWKPKTLSEINEEDLKWYYEPLPNNLDLKNLINSNSKI